MADLKILRDIIRQNMDRESVSEVLLQMGYEVMAGKFFLRDERTPSAIVFNDGWIEDSILDAQDGDFIHRQDRSYNEQLASYLNYEHGS